MIKQAAVGLATTLFALQAGAAMLTFNDLPTFTDPLSPTGIRGDFFDNTGILTDATYQGFRFANENGNRWFWNPNQGPDYFGAAGTTWLGVSNPSTAGITNNFAPAITSATDFVFDGASFTGFESVRFVLSLNGAEVFTSAACGPLATTATFCASGYSGLVDKVVIESVHSPTFTGTFFAMDNFTFNSSQTVPEPTGLALVTAGLALAGLSRRRQRTR